MTHRNNIMFRQLERQLARNAEIAKEDAAERARHAEEQEARLDAPLTRREVLEAIESVAHEYGCNGNHDSDLICDAFRKLAEALS